MEEIITPAPSAGEVPDNPKEEPEKENLEGNGQQDPLQQELEKVRKSGRTKRERLIFTKKKIEQQLQELNKEEGIEPSPEEDNDEAPLTKGEFKRIQQEQTTKTALQLAEDINNETERELTKYHLQNTIKSTGNPKQDLAMAMAIVNSQKNRQILEQINGKPEAKRGVYDGGSAPKGEEEQEFTQEELSFMRAPFNLSKEQILEARKGKVQGIVK